MPSNKKLKNDVVWLRRQEEAEDMLGKAKEKYSAGEMIWADYH